MVAIDPRVGGYKNAELLLAQGVDVICGGFPCQDISTAGKGAGITGSRSGLWREMLRTIRLVRPRFAFVENVAALLYRGMGTVLGELAESGYDTEWGCISAADVGAPHLRERIWIVGSDSHSKHVITEQKTAKRWFSQTANAEGSRGAVLRTEWEKMAYSEHPGLQERRGDKNSGEELQHACGISSHEQSSIIQEAREVFHAHGERLEKCHTSVIPGRARLADWRFNQGRVQWESEPRVGRVADGVPNRVDCLKGLGNSVVPQIPEIIGNCIMRVA